MSQFQTLSTLGVILLLAPMCFGSVLLLERHSQTGSYYASVTLSGRNLYTAAHVLNLCPLKCKGFKLYYFDSAKRQLRLLEQRLKKPFKIFPDRDLAIAELSQGFKVPDEASLPKTNAPHCASFTALAKNSYARRIKLNDIIKGLETSTINAKTLAALVQTSLPAPAVFDLSKQELKNSKFAQISYIPTPNPDIFYVETIFPLLSEFEQDANLLKVPCAGWFASSGGAFFQANSLVPTAVISGPSSSFIAALRDHIDFGNLNVTHLP